MSSKHASLTQFAMSEPEAFVAWCDKLRGAGVVKLGALVLGAKPHDGTREKREVDPDAEARRKHDVMFASSRIKPPFEPPPPSEGGKPRIIVQRQARDEAARGAAKSQG